MLAGNLVLHEVWRDHRFAIAVPVSVRPVSHLGDDVEVVKQPSLVKLASDGLDVKKRQACLEVDRDVRLPETQIGKEWSEPTIGFDDALKQFVAKTARKIWNGSDQQTPTRFCAGDQATPDLDVTGLGESRYEWRRTSLQVIWRMFVKIGFEVRELRRTQRIPLLCSAECPFDVGPVKLERECERWKYPPPEGGCSRHGVAITEGARWQHAARRAIGALRCRTIWDHPEECDDPFVGFGFRHLYPPATGR